MFAASFEMCLKIREQEIREKMPKYRRNMEKLDFFQKFEVERLWLSEHFLN